MVNWVKREYNIAFRDGEGSTSISFLEKLAKYSITRVRRTFMPMLIYRTKQMYNEKGKMVKKRGGISAATFDKETHVRMLKMKGDEKNQIIGASNNMLGIEIKGARCSGNSEDKMGNKAASEIVVRVEKYFTTNESMTKMDYEKIVSGIRKEQESLKENNNNVREIVEIGKEHELKDAGENLENLPEMRDYFPVMPELPCFEEKVTYADAIFENVEGIGETSVSCKEKECEEVEGEVGEGRFKDEKSDPEKINSEKVLDSMMKESDKVEEEDNERTESEEDGGKEYSENVNDEDEDEAMKKSNRDEKEKTLITEKNNEEDKGNGQTKASRAKRGKRKVKKYVGKTRCGSCILEVETTKNEEVLLKLYGDDMMCAGTCKKTLYEVVDENNMAWVCKNCQRMECRLMYCFECRKKSNYDRGENEEPLKKRLRKRK